MGKKRDYEIIMVDENDIPEIVTAQFAKLEALDAKVKQAMEKADKAKDSAENAHNKSAGWTKRKEAIESLQEATLDLAEAQISSADSQKVAFECQEKLGKITQYLFALGASNIAANRSVVRQLELKLKGASEEELSDMARQEVLNVIKQLKAQEDLMNKQEKLSSKVKDHDKRITAQEQKGFALGSRIDSTEHSIEETEQRLQEHEDLLDVREKKDEEHDILLKEGKEKDEEQDILLAKQIEKDKEHDRLFEEQKEKDEEHDRLLVVGKEKDEEHDRRLEEVFNLYSAQDKQITELNAQVTELNNQIKELKRKSFSNSLGVITLLCAISAVILCIVQFLM